MPLKKVLIVTVLLNASFALVANETDEPSAKDILNNVFKTYFQDAPISNFGGNSISFDYSTNYMYQGYELSREMPFSNRPGITTFHLDFDNQSLTEHSYYRYLQGLYGTLLVNKQGQSQRVNLALNEYQNRAQPFDDLLTQHAMLQPIWLLKVLSDSSVDINANKLQINHEELTYRLCLSHLILKEICLNIDKQNHYILSATQTIRSTTMRFLYRNHIRANGKLTPTYIVKSREKSAYPAVFIYAVKVVNDDLSELSHLSLPKQLKEAKKSDTMDGQIRVQQLSDTVTWITKNAAVSLFVEFSDYILLVDAFDRGLEERIGVFKSISDKPIKRVSISHHHHDHIRALPNLLAGGIQLVTTSPILQYVSETFDLNKDQTTNALVVNNRLTLSDETQKVTMYELTEMQHAKNMMLTYIHKEQLVYLPDHYEEMYLRENKHAIIQLLQFLEREKLPVSGFIQGHGNDLYSTEFIKKEMTKTNYIDALPRDLGQEVKDINTALHYLQQ
ncbi:hypothetical protein [Agaribacter flavus]|uniref:Metallo-beta-lactamase domain-containing protein n=1 Tax=Agaribacter flavus TaxID=1902781 RepID=A0ABV7FRB8_9ALTE